MEIRYSGLISDVGSQVAELLRSGLGFHHFGFGVGRTDIKGLGWEVLKPDFMSEGGQDAQGLRPLPWGTWGGLCCDCVQVWGKPDACFDALFAYRIVFDLQTCSCM